MSARKMGKGYGKKIVRFAGLSPPAMLSTFAAASNSSPFFLRFNTMDCPTCGEPFPSHVRHCPACQADVGFPNVREAQRSEERQALDTRYTAALSAAAASSTQHTAADFCDAIQKRSQAVICYNIGALHKLVSSDNELYATFYQLVRAGARLPEDNEMDRIRGSIDAMLFPHYHEEIRFAALSLNGRGVTSYGAYTVVIDTQKIHLRSTVFECNSLHFFQRNVTAWKPPPPGFRAEWRDRDKLTLAKLGTRMKPDTSSDEFPGLLLHSDGDRDKDEFVEVHIYGPINRRSIECVFGPKPKKKQDKVLFEKLRETLDDINVPLNVYP